MILYLIRFGIPILVALYLGRRVMQFISPPRRLAIEDPIGRANAIGGRIVGYLEESESNPIYQVALRQISDLVDERLPKLVMSRDRIGGYLNQRDLHSLQAEIEELTRELEAAVDPALRTIHEKNLKLTKDRMENLKHLAVLRQRTNAQIRNVILALENLEDRVVATRLITAGPDVACEIEHVLQDVAELEEEYSRLSLPAA